MASIVCTDELGYGCGKKDNSENDTECSECANKLITDTNNANCKFRLNEVVYFERKGTGIPEKGIIAKINPKIDIDQQNDAAIGIDQMVTIKYFDKAYRADRYDQTESINCIYKSLDAFPSTRNRRAVQIFANPAPVVINKSNTKKSNIFTTSPSKRSDDTNEFTIRSPKSFSNKRAGPVGGRGEVISLDGTENDEESSNGHAVVTINEQHKRGKYVENTDITPSLFTTTKKRRILKLAGPSGSSISIIDNDYGVNSSNDNAQLALQLNRVFQQCSMVELLNIYSEYCEHNSSNQQHTNVSNTVDTCVITDVSIKKGLLCALYCWFTPRLTKSQKEVLGKDEITGREFEYRKPDFLVSEIFELIELCPISEQGIRHHPKLSTKFTLLFDQQENSIRSRILEIIVSNLSRVNTNTNLNSISDLCKINDSSIQTNNDIATILNSSSSNDGNDNNNHNGSSISTTNNNNNNNNNNNSNDIQRVTITTKSATVISIDRDDDEDGGNNIGNNTNEVNTSNVSSDSSNVTSQQQQSVAVPSLSTGQKLLKEMRRYLSERYIDIDAINDKNSNSNGSISSSSHSIRSGSVAIGNDSSSNGANSAITTDVTNNENLPFDPCDERVVHLVQGLQSKYCYSHSSHSFSDTKRDSTNTSPLLLPLSYTQFIDVMQVVYLLMGGRQNIEYDKDIRGAKVTSEGLQAMYGGVTESLVELFIERTRLGRSSSYLDIGSGIGQTCIQVAATVCCQRVTGIEIDTDRYNSSLELLQAFNYLLRQLRVLPPIILPQPPTAAVNETESYGSLSTTVSHIPTNTTSATTTTTSFGQISVNFIKADFKHCDDVIKTSTVIYFNNFGPWFTDQLVERCSRSINNNGSDSGGGGGGGVYDGDYNNDMPFSSFTSSSSSFFYTGSGSTAFATTVIENIATDADMAITTASSSSSSTVNNINTPETETTTTTATSTSITTVETNMTVERANSHSTTTTASKKKTKGARKTSSLVTAARKDLISPIHRFCEQLEGIEDGKGTGVQIITLNPIIGASHWLALDKFVTQRSVASWSDAAMDMYHYTILTQEWCCSRCTKNNWLFLEQCTICGTETRQRSSRQKDGKNSFLCR